MPFIRMRIMSSLEVNQIAWDHLLRGEDDANIARVIRVVTRWISGSLMHFSEQNLAEEHLVALGFTCLAEPVPSYT